VLDPELHPVTNENPRTVLDPEPHPVSNENPRTVVDPEPHPFSYAKCYAFTHGE
jgi:hypothetical protein